jgi:DNA-binding GntR family transcriptional regulator
MLMDPGHHAKIALLQSSSLTTVVQQEIERAILVGDTLPAQADERQRWPTSWACRAGPVREAFRMLEEAGLVRTEKNRGVFRARHPDRRSGGDFRSARRHGRAGGPPPGRTSRPTQLKEIKGLVDAMERREGRGHARLPPAEPQFHDRLVEMAGNRKLTAIYRKLIKELSLFRRLNLADGWLMPISAGEHRPFQSHRHQVTPRRRPRHVRPRDGKQGAHGATICAANPRPG